MTSALSFASKMPSRLMEENIRQHQDIIDALTERNASAVREAMVDHVTKTMHLVLDWMSRR